MLCFRSMNLLRLPSSLLVPSLSHKSPTRLQLHPENIYKNCLLRCSYLSTCLSLTIQSKFPHYSFCTRQSLVSSAIPSNEGTVPVINFEDLVEKDWSFLDSDDLNREQHKQNIGRIISGGEIEEASRILVSIGSEGFVDRLVESSPCQLLLAVHDSLLVLAGIKEKYDKVKCWQGELIYVPEKWVPFDIVFLYFLPGLPFKLDQIFEALAKRCSQGARLVISHPQGREGLEQQQKRFPDVIVSSLPDKMTLQKAADNYSFELKEFVDKPGFYLAVLKFCKARS